MNTKLVNTAADVINAALTQNRTAAGIALSLESAQLLMSPEISAELKAFRSLELADIDGRVSASCPEPGHSTWLRAKGDVRGCPWCRVEELLAERQTTNAALVDVTLAQRAAEGRPVDEDPIAYALTEAAEASADKLTRLLAPTQALREDSGAGDDAEVFVPRTERSYWVAIADALNAAHSVGMAVGIDLDGTLTDRNAWSVVWDRNAERWTVAGYEDEGEIADAAPLTVFRASHDSIGMGLYTTRQAAYEHCEAHELRDDRVSPMAWNVDEDGVAELVRIRIPRSPGTESPTGYVVTPLEVASEYDEEADE
ncbi:hypothetical protein [Streptomyces sp. NPDC088812]|uniref:hypothetical protein n=1 Tax=Streptomyces sp. NPDC088812 TaxID=3365905 RepID=UPI0037F33D04